MFSQNNTLINKVLFGVEPPVLNGNNEYASPKIAHIFKKNGTKLDLGIFTNDSYKEISAVIFSTTGTLGKAVVQSNSQNTMVRSTRYRIENLDNFIAENGVEKFGVTEVKLSETHKVICTRTPHQDIVWGSDMHFCSLSEHKETHLDGLHIYYNPYAEIPLDEDLFNFYEITQNHFDKSTREMIPIHNNGSLVSRQTFYDSSFKQPIEQNEQWREYEEVILKWYKKVLSTIKSEYVANQFVLEELESAQIAQTDESLAWIKESGFNDDDFKNALSNSLPEVDGANGPQQTLNRCQIEDFGNNFEFSSKLRREVVNRIMRHYALGKYSYDYETEHFINDNVSYHANYTDNMNNFEFKQTKNDIPYIQDGNILMSSPNHADEILEDYKINNINSKKIKKIGRNQLCPCGSKKKYKKCCGSKIVF